jgi:hypothetical protein
MKREKILPGAVAGIAMLLLFAAAQSNAWAGGGGDDDTLTTRTIGIFAAGNGMGADDKTTGHCDTTLYPDLTCIPGDTCGCLSGSSTDFSGGGICNASLTNMQISFDFAGPTDFNGIPNGSIADPTPLTGRCYGASGFALITTTDADSDTINLILQGVFCDAIPGQDANNASFNGTYIVKGGTGAYAAAVGTGSFTASIDNVNTLPSLSPMTFSATGGITALFSSDKPCQGDGGDPDSKGDLHSHNHHGHGKG